MGATRGTENARRAKLRVSTEAKSVVPNRNISMDVDCCWNWFPHFHYSIRFRNTENTHIWTHVQTPREIMTFENTDKLSFKNKRYGIVSGRCGQLRLLTEQLLHNYSRLHADMRWCVLKRHPAGDQHYFKINVFNNSGNPFYSNPF